MVELIKIDPGDLQKLVSIAYWEDYELFRRYHIKQFDNIYDAVKATMDMMEEFNKVLPLTYWAVIHEGYPIGYMASYQQFLYSFGINIRRRKKEILMEWMAALRKEFGYDFFCCLESGNTRCIEFLQKNHMVIDYVDSDNNFVKLINEYSGQN